MDEATERALARFQHRMKNADRLYDKAEARMAAADAIERSLALPVHLRPLDDETTLRLEAKLLRQQASELTREADGIQQRLYEPPSPELTQQIEERAARFDRTMKDLGDRDRGRDRER